MSAMVPTTIPAMTPPLRIALEVDGDAEFITPLSGFVMATRVCVFVFSKDTWAMVKLLRSKSAIR